MSKNTEILRKYTAKEITAEEANEQLEGVKLVPGKNALTNDEIMSSFIGEYPSMARGFGLLDTGTGTLDKVAVKDGKLVDCDCGDSFALFVIAGRVYEVNGDTLEDVKVEDAETEEVKESDVWKFCGQNPRYAGHKMRIRCPELQEVADVWYDEDGNAYKSVFVRKL